MKLHPFFCLLLCILFLFSCKGDKPVEAGSETITINGTKALILGIDDLVERPTDADPDDYIEVEAGKEVQFSYTGIEKDKITWTYDGSPLGKGTSLNTSHSWTEPGIKEVKAILSDGQERTVYVMVRQKEISETTPAITKVDSVSDNSGTNKYSSSTPPVNKPDLDKDEIPDSEDECKDKKGDKANKGCPWPDSDGDGVPDKDDECKDQLGLNLVYRVHYLLQ